MSGIEYAIGDPYTTTRMNLKTRFVGTGAQIAAITGVTGKRAYCTTTGSGFTAGNSYVYNGTAWVTDGWLVDTGTNIAAYTNPSTGMHAYCTTNGSGLVAGTEYYYNGSAWVDASAINTDVEIYPYSTTLSDYSTPVSAQHREYTVSFGVDAGATLSIYNGGNTRGGQLITDTNLRNRNITSVSLYLSKTNSPPGSFTITIRKTSDDSLVGTLATVTASTLNASATLMTYATNIFSTPNEDFRLLVEYTDAGSSSTNRINLQWSTSSTYANGYALNYTSGGGYTSNPSQDTAGSFKYIYSGGNTAANAIDGSTGSFSLSGAGGEINPALRLELSASADKEPAAIVIYPDNAFNTVTQFKIQTSPDDVTYTDRRLVNWSSLTAGAYTYLRFNRDTAQVRYLRLWGTDGTAKLLGVYEIKVLLPTESQWNRRHGHKSISATDATLSNSA